MGKADRHLGSTSAPASTIHLQMRPAATRPLASVRPVALSALAVATMVAPDGIFSPLTNVPHELTILRMLALVGVSLLAALPWASTAPLEVRRRLRRWLLPGVTCTVIYLISTETLYLVLGFCLLSGATLDVWMSRAHIASDTMRTRLTSSRDD